MTSLARHSLFVLAVSGLVSSAFGDAFKDQIQPVLKSYCVACHGPEAQKGKIRVDHLTASMDERKETMANKGNHHFFWFCLAFFSASSFAWRALESSVRVRVIRFPCRKTRRMPMCGV